MNILDLLLPETESESRAGKIFGVVVGVVTNNQDPEKMGRVKVRFPWLNETDESHWARVATLMAGKDRGTWFLPEVDDEVLVAFGHGDVRFPYVVGALWNGVDTPPRDNDDGKNNERVVKSRLGHELIFGDEGGKGRWRLRRRPATKSCSTTPRGRRRFQSWTSRATTRSSWTRRPARSP
jgi:uncharacterized protein involved in type VI secretion and phage assembly